MTVQESVDKEGLNMATLQKPNEEKVAVPSHDTWLHPWGDFDRMRQAMDAVLSGFWPRRLLADSATPAVNMYRDDGNLIVEAAIPGMKKDDIKVSLLGNTLSIEGESKHENKVEKDDYYFTEMHRGSFSRRVRLPVEVKSEEIKAEYKDGMLKLTMAMLAPHKEKPIEVKVK